MPTSYTKSELRSIHQTFTKVVQPGPPRPWTLEEIVAANAILVKTTDMINEVRPHTERGVRVLDLRIHPEWAPTMNMLANWNARQPWRPGKTKNAIEAVLRKLLEEIPDLALNLARKRRWARVTRWTSQPKNVDDAAIDQIGGKLPIDMMKRVGIIVDDSPAWLHREAHVIATRPGNTHVQVEIFECAEEQVHSAPPEPGICPPPLVVPRSGKTTEHIDDGAAPKKRRARASSKKTAAGMTIGDPTRSLPFGGDK